MKPQILWNLQLLPTVAASANSRQDAQNELNVFLQVFLGRELPNNWKWNFQGLSQIELHLPKP